VLICTLHTLTDLRDVGKDSLLVSFAKTLRRRDLVALSARRHEVGMLRVEQGEETVEQHVIRHSRRVLVLPNAGSLDHIALNLLLSRGLGVIALLFVSNFSGELGLEVVGGSFLWLLGLLLLFQA
jgi:hypothetical protein